MTKFHCLVILYLYIYNIIFFFKGKRGEKNILVMLEVPEAVLFGVLLELRVQDGLTGLQQYLLRWDETSVMQQRNLVHMTSQD